MLAPRPKTKRLLETVQILLTFASVCAVVDASWIHTSPHGGAGYYAGGGLPQGRARGDRQLGDLARTERKRREAELKEALEQR
jgi:hypothetical protein